MKSAFFIAEIKTPLMPSHEFGKSEQSFLAYLIERAKKDSSMSLLGVGAALLDLSSGLNAMSYLVDKAEEFHIQHRVLFFEEEPSWIITNNKEKED